MAVAEKPKTPLQIWQERLVSTFTNIAETRMQGVPVLHSGLTVNADYFLAWNDYYLGVLITPWFMNLLLVPANETSRTHLQQFMVGKKETHVFPSGAYEFIVGHEDDIGPYESCSLFSPMFEFADQQAALDTAQAVMQGLMNEENLEQIDLGYEQSLRGISNEIESSSTVQSATLKDGGVENEDNEDNEKIDESEESEESEENKEGEQLTDDERTNLATLTQAPLAKNLTETNPAGISRRALLFGRQR